MYNEALKQSFITEKESTCIVCKNYLKRSFEKSEPMENKMDKDLSDFTVYEIIELYKRINSSSIKTLTVLNNTYSQYAQYCLQRNLVEDSQNHFLEIDRQHLQDCVNAIAVEKSYVPREILLQWISMLPNPSDGFILLCLFEGIKGEDYKEIVRIKMSDFNGNELTLCNGRKVIVSDELIRLARLSNEELIYTPISTKIETKQFKLLDEDKIIKSYPNVQVSDQFQEGRRLYTRILRLFKFLDVEKWMTGNKLRNSGKVWFVLKRMEELNISVDEYINSYSDELMGRFYTSRIIKSHLKEEIERCSS